MLGGWRELTVPGRRDRRFKQAHGLIPTGRCACALPLKGTSLGPKRRATQLEASLLGVSLPRLARPSRKYGHLFGKDVGLPGSNP
jgi:hypothetical protein